MPHPVSCRPPEYRKGLVWYQEGYAGPAMDAFSDKADLFDAGSFSSAGAGHWA